MTREVETDKSVKEDIEKARREILKASPELEGNLMLSDGPFDFRLRTRLPDAKWRSMSPEEASIQRAVDRAVFEHMKSLKPPA